MLTPQKWNALRQTHIRSFLLTTIASYPWSQKLVVVRSLTNKDTSFLSLRRILNKIFEESKHELSDLCDLIADILELHFKAVDEDKKTS